MGQFGQDLAGGFDAVERGHGDVHDHDVGSMLLGEGEGFAAVGNISSMTCEARPSISRRKREAAAHHGAESSARRMRMAFIGQHHAQVRALARLDLTAKVPPRWLTRSCIPNSPMHLVLEQPGGRFAIVVNGEEGLSAS